MLRPRKVSDSNSASESCTQLREGQNYPGTLISWSTERTPPFGYPTSSKYSDVSSSESWQVLSYLSFPSVSHSGEGPSTLAKTYRWCMPRCILPLTKSCAGVRCRNTSRQFTGPKQQQECETNTSTVLASVLWRNNAAHASRCLATATSHPYSPRIRLSMQSSQLIQHMFIESDIMRDTGASLILVVFLGLSLL